MRISSLRKIKKEHVHLFFAVLVIAVLVVLFVLRPFGVPETKAWFSNYQYRKQITFDRTLVPGVTSQPNFPVLVSFTDPDLVQDADCTIGSPPIGGPCNAIGWDIVFTDAADVQLDYEIEIYTPGTGAIVMWVRVNPLNGALAGSDTSIYMYYGKNGVVASTENRDAVWDANYQGVWHMANTGSGAGAFTDTSGTSPANNGTGAGTKLVSVSSPTSKIGRAWGFNATTPFDSYVDMGNPASLFDDDTAGSGFTVEAWIKRTVPTSNAFGHYIFSDYDSTGELSSFALRISGTNVPADQDKIAFFWANPTGTFPMVFSTTVTSQGSWYHVVGVWDTASATRRIYINGVQENTNVGGQTRTDIGGNTAIARTGSFADAAFYFGGEVDEVRFSNTARTANWITTEYNNQQNQGCKTGGCTPLNPAAFISFVTDVPEQSNPPPTTPTFVDTPPSANAFANWYTNDTTPLLGTFFSTDTTDPIEYEIEWDDGTDFSPAIATRNSVNHLTNGFSAPTFSSGAFVSYQIDPAGTPPDVALTSGTTYWWHARARDPAGSNSWSGYSTPRSFTINTVLPADAWYQTTSDQFTLPANATVDIDPVPVAGPGGGVKVKGW